MPKPPEAQRLSQLLAAGDRTRTLILTYDAHDSPPWTAELRINGKLSGLRAGATLQDAITRVQQTLPYSMRGRVPRNRD